MIRKLFKRYSVYQYMEIALWCMFIGQVFMLAVFNLTQMQYHMGFDASSYYLKAMEMAKQGTPFIKEWVDQTTLYFDAAVPFAAVIYAVTGNIFVSYGLVNLVIDAAIFYMFYSILKLLNISDLASSVCLNMIACIYISPTFANVNDIGYFSSLLSSGSWYGLKILIILMVIKLILDMENGKKNYLFMLFTGVFLFISGVSSGWYLLVTIMVPLLLFYIIRVFVKNSFRELYNSRVLIICAGSLLILIGKFVAVHILDFTSKDSVMVLVTLQDFWKNIGSIILGFMELVVAFPKGSNQNALELDGIVYLMGLTVFVLCVTGFVYIMRKWVKEYERYNNYGIPICILLVNIIMFSVLYTTYGSEIFEIRYLIILFLALVMAVGALIDGLKDQLLLKKCGVAAVFFILLVLNGYCDMHFLQTKNNYEILEAVVEEVDGLGTPVVYVCGDDLRIDGRNLRVIDEKRVYRYVSGELLNNGRYWGDYTYYADAADAGNYNVMITMESFLEQIPEYIRNKYVLHSQIDKFLIYTSEVSRFDLKSGVTGDYSIDYITSPGMAFSGGILNEINGSYVSAGTEGWVIWGPGTVIEPGNYDFIINYEILGNTDKTANFVVTVNSGEYELASLVLDNNQNKAILNVDVQETMGGMEYKVYNYQGTIIKVDSFEVIRN